MKMKQLLAALALCAGIVTATQAAWLIKPPVFTVWLFDGPRSYVMYKGTDSTEAHRIHWALAGMGYSTGLIAAEEPLANE